MKDSRLHNVWFLNVGVLCVALLLIAKLGYIEIAQGEYYRDKAEARPKSKAGKSIFQFLKEKEVCDKKLRRALP